MSVIIKDMEMPVDCLACRINCKNEHYLEDGRPFDCPLEEAKTGDLISRADAIDAIDDAIDADSPQWAILRTKIGFLPSADAVQGWIPFTCRPMTEEEQKYYPNCTFMFDCVLPDDGEEILVSNRRFVWMDTFCVDIDGCYLDRGDDIDEDMAWMPLPKPYEPKTERRG